MYAQLRMYMLIPRKFERKIGIHLEKIVSIQSNDNSYVIFETFIRKNNFEILRELSLKVNFFLYIEIGCNYYY